MHPGKRRGHFGHGHGHRGGNGRGWPRFDRDPLLGRGVLDRSELQLLLLSLIGAEARHGYDLIRSIKALSGGAYAPSSGVVYPALLALSGQDLATSTEDETGRKTFAITEAGKKEIGAKGSEIAALVKRVSSLAETDDAQLAPVRRALSNLYAVLDNVLKAEAEGASAYDVAALIDEAAQKIERLSR